MAVSTVFSRNPSFGNVHSTPCVGTGISCEPIFSTILCGITTDNGTTGSYLFNQCTRQSNPEIVAHVDTFSGFSNDRLTLDVGPGVIGITLLLKMMITISFSTKADVCTCIHSFDSPFSVNPSQDFLKQLA